MAGSARMSDVAKLAGVSTMTVSRALNKAPHVSEDMRRRVFAAIEHLRYQPNELARSLREQRSRQIGVLVPNLSDPFFATCAHMISTVAKKHSYSVVLSTTNEDQQAEYEEANRMLRRNVEGLIVIPANLGGNVSLLLAHEFERLPIVTLDRPIAGSRFDSLLVENELGAKVGTRHLISLGHKRILFLGLSDHVYTMKMRHAGYNAAMQAAGLTPQSAVISGEREETRRVLHKLLATKGPPTALFCANNLTTRQVLYGLQEMGIQPPKKVALVGFDDFEMADILRPGITVVRQPTELLGRTAAEILFERLNSSHPLKPGKGRVLPAELVIRGSCGARL
jgi:LacI family transcriptional regulator